MPTWKHFGEKINASLGLAKILPMFSIADVIKVIFLATSDLVLERKIE